MSDKQLRTTRPATAAVIYIVLVLSFALSLAACGDADDADEAGRSATPAQGALPGPSANGPSDSSGVRPHVESERPTGAIVRVGRSDYGRILQDRRGRTLYLFTKETGGKSECYGECAKAWPPLLTRGEPRAGGGAIARELGVTRRRDGRRQVTYNGHPLYYYVDEDEPGEVLCQAVPEFGGIWYVVDRRGEAITRQ